MKSKCSKGITNAGLLVAVLIIAIGVFVFAKLVGLLGGDKFQNFKKDFDDYADSLKQDYLMRKSNSLTQPKESKFYYEIANGVSISDDTVFEPTGTLIELGLDVKPQTLSGTEFYEIKKDTNIVGVSFNQNFSGSSEKHYVTDAGEVFFLPGFMQEEEGVKRWYINSQKYYESDNPVNSIEGASIGEAKVLSDVNSNKEAGTNLKKGIKSYIVFDAMLNGKKLTIEPAVPFEVENNGTYNFKLTSSGRVFYKSVTVNNYRQKNPTDILKIGDYVSYTADNKTYKTTKNDTGDLGQTLVTEKKDWRVIYIDPNTEDVYITTNGIVNDGIHFSGANGIAKGVETLNTICKELYSNSKLKLEARCMTIEDANKIFGKEEPKEKTRYAYYPRGTTVTGTEEYEGNTYTKVTNEWRTSRFYIYDGGGEDATDNNGIKVKDAKQDKPVFVTQTFYEYKNENTSSALKNILGEKSAWLASQSVLTNKNGAGFGIRTINANGVNASIVYDSFANISNVGNAIHPIVEIKSNDFTFDFDSKTQNGKSADKAWKFSKEQN